MSHELCITVMSGVDDGSLFKCSAENGDGHRNEAGIWVFNIGRHDSNDICLNNDTFISRMHARIFWHNDHWWVEDCDSTNGTFIEMPDEDKPVKEAISVAPGQLFRIGRTWLRIESEASEE